MQMYAQSLDGVYIKGGLHTLHAVFYMKQNVTLQVHFRKPWKEKLLLETIYQLICFL